MVLPGIFIADFSQLIALRQYLSEISLIESRVSTQAEKLVQFMEEQGGKSFDPAECLNRAVADVILWYYLWRRLRYNQPRIEQAVTG